MKEQQKAELIAETRAIHEEEQRHRAAGADCAWRVAECISRLQHEFGMKHREIAEALGWASVKKVSKYIYLWRTHRDKKGDPAISPWALMNGDIKNGDGIGRGRLRKYARENPEAAADLLLDATGSPRVWARSSRRFIEAIGRRYRAGEMSNAERAEVTEALSETALACADLLDAFLRDTEPAPSAGRLVVAG